MWGWVSPAAVWDPPHTLPTPGWGSRVLPFIWMGPLVPPGIGRPWPEGFGSSRFPHHRMGPLRSPSLGWAPPSPPIPNVRSPHSSSCLEQCPPVSPRHWCGGPQSPHPWGSAQQPLTLHPLVPRAPLSPCVSPGAPLTPPVPQVYWLGPVLGAVLAGLSYEFVFSPSASREKLGACLACRDVALVETTSPSPSSPSARGPATPPAERGQGTA